MAIPVAFLALFVVACLGAWEVIAVLVSEEMSALETVIGDGIGPGDDPRFEIDCGEGCAELLLGLRPIDDIKCVMHGGAGFGRGACCVVNPGTETAIEFHVWSQDGGTFKIAPRGWKQRTGTTTRNRPERS